MKKFIALVLCVVLIGGVLSGCDPASTATNNLKTEAESFKLYRRITAINNQSDKVLFEIEGFFNYTNEADGDLSIVMEVARDSYKRHVVHLNDRTTFVVEQLEASEFSAYSYKIRIFAAYPDISIGK